MAAIRLWLPSLHCTYQVRNLVPMVSNVPCIQGRPFAMQEAIMALAMILQKFNFELVDPNYELEVMQTLTVKPKNLFIHAIPRKDIYTTA